MVYRETLMPTYRVVEWRDGAVFRTAPGPDVWVPIEIANRTGAQAPFQEDPDLRLGTPTSFETRRGTRDWYPISDRVGRCGVCESTDWITNLKRDGCSIHKR